MIETPRRAHRTGLSEEFVDKLKTVIVQLVKSHGQKDVIVAALKTLRNMYADRD